MSHSPNPRPFCGRPLLESKVLLQQSTSACLRFLVIDTSPEQNSPLSCGSTHEPIQTFDALVAMKFLDREGDGPQAAYFNTPEGAMFLDAASPRYIGGILIMLNTRLFKFWNDLPESITDWAAPRTRSGTGRMGCLRNSIQIDPGWNSFWVR
ncbi:MAG: hypothetical protein U0236_14365 [Nitrospira sp.]